MNFMLYGAVENFSLLKKLKDLINSAALIWMFCRKIFYSKIETIHHRTLKVIYGIDDSYNLCYAVTLSQFIKGTFDS